MDSAPRQLARPESLVCEPIFSELVHSCARYSKDLALYHFCFFLKVKGALKRTYFHSVENLKAKEAKLLKKMTLDKLPYCFDQWNSRMQHFSLIHRRLVSSNVKVGVEYDEGDKIQL